MKIKALRHFDVKGREQFYLQITSNTKELMMNVGRKTYETITEMEQEEKQPELPLPENKTTPEEGQTPKKPK